MKAFTTPFLDTLGRLALALLVVGAASSRTHAQTVFAHDPAGNRVAQEGAAGSSAPFITTMPADQVAMLGGLIDAWVVDAVRSTRRFERTINTM